MTATPPLRAHALAAGKGRFVTIVGATLGTTAIAFPRATTPPIDYPARPVSRPEVRPAYASTSP